MATKNIVPNADSEGQLGTSSKFWSSAYLDGLNIGNDAAANLVFTPSASDTITLASAANGAFTITTVDAAAAAANVGFVVDGNFTVSNVTSTITSSSSDITTFATTNATSGYTEFAYNTSTVAGYIGNGTSLLSGAANTDFIMRSESGAIKFTTGGGNLALTIDSSQNATFAGKSDITTSVSGFASTITNNKDDSQGVLIRTSDNDGGEYILDLQSSSSATGTDYASKFNVAKGGSATFAGGVAVAGASSLPLSDSSALNAGIQIPTNAQLGFGNGATSKPDFGFAVQGTSGSAKLNIFCGTGGTDVDAFFDTNGFFHAAALFLGGETSANTLDDYEEGSWTPRITDGTDVAQSNGTYTRGDYTKVGRLVHCSGQIVLTDLTSSGGAEVNGAIRMDGFPFANRNVQGAQSAGIISSASFLNITAGHTVVLQMLLNVAEAGFRLTDSTGGTTDMQASEFSDDGQITFSISYMTDL